MDLARRTPSGKTTSSKALPLAAQGLEDQEPQEVGFRKIVLSYYVIFLPFLRVWVFASLRLLEYSPSVCCGAGARDDVSTCIQNDGHDFATPVSVIDFFAKSTLSRLSSSSSSSSVL